MGEIHGDEPRQRIRPSVLTWRIQSFSGLFCPCPPSWMSSWDVSLSVTPARGLPSRSCADWFWNARRLRTAHAVRVSVKSPAMSTSLSGSPITANSRLPPWNRQTPSTQTPLFQIHRWRMMIPFHHYRRPLSIQLTYRTAHSLSSTPNAHVTFGDPIPIYSWPTWQRRVWSLAMPSEHTSPLSSPLPLLLTPFSPAIC